MIRPIVPYGASILRKPALPADPGSPGIPHLLQDLWDTMANAQGAGLAAPQIGISLRVFVVEVEALRWKGVFINPGILETGGALLWENEGCLSMPGLSGSVPRHAWIKVRFTDEEGRLREETFENEAARVIQHEYDHLNGVLYTDRMRPLARRLLQGRLQAIQNGKFSSPYPMARR